MASYTDTVPKFNPYVKQLPVEAMVEVGMYKQQKYDEGIQKIQTNIDNIAGLDVIRDVDKAYLQSKLNQLGNELTTVAAGDFSNFQLVNSVNGMTNQISKDPNVLNAISSAGIYRKGLADKDAANKAGKGSASNDWLFGTEANDWLSSPDIKKSFNGGYKQYTDYRKNAQEVIKGLVKNETGRDVAFETGPNGEMVVLDAMTRTKISGITPERIQTALKVGLSPNDFQQMQIDGRYNYSGSTPEQFVSDINNSYKKDYDNLKYQRDTIANAMDSTNSAIVKSNLQKQLDSLDKSLTVAADEYKSVTKSFAQGDVESAKARLHTTKWMSEFSQTFASQDIEQTYETSPFQQVKQFRETKADEYKKWLADYNQRNAFHKDEQYYKEREDKRAQTKSDREEAEAAGYGGLPFSVPQGELPEVTLDKINDIIATDEANIIKSDTAIMQRYKKAGDESWLNLQYSQWQKSPGSVDAVLADHFKTTETSRREIAANTAMVATINNTADEKYGKIEKYIPAGSKPVTVKFPNGQYTYTPKDFVDFNNKFKNYIIQSGSSGSRTATQEVSYDYEKAKKELSDKEYYLLQSRIRQTGSAQQLLTKNLVYYNDKVNKPFGAVVAQKDKWIAAQVQQRVVAMQGVEYGVPLNNETQKTSFGNALVGFANLADSQTGGLPNSPGLSTSDLRKIAGGVQNASIRIVEGNKFAPGMYELTVANAEGATQTFRVPPEAYRSVFGNKFEADPAIQAIRPIETQMIRAGGMTTALDGQQTTRANAFLGNTLSFPNVNHYSVSANVVKSENSDLYHVRLNVTNPITGEKIVEDLGYPTGGLIEKNKISAALSGLTDQRIFELLYHRPPTAEEMKKLK